jgi:hypothetical protein
MHQNAMSDPRSKVVGGGGQRRSRTDRPPGAEPRHREILLLLRREPRARKLAGMVCNAAENGGYTIAIVVPPLIVLLGSVLAQNRGRLAVIVWAFVLATTLGIAVPLAIALVAGSGEWHVRFASAR